MKKSGIKKVVIDTNVLVSALWSENGNPASIIQLIPQTITPVFSYEIFAEYLNVLNRPKFDFSPHKKKELLSKLMKYGEFVSPEKSDIPMADESDRIFYDAAKENGAILITGNDKHFPDEKHIMKPLEFLENDASG